MAYRTVNDVFDGLHHCCPGFQVYWRSGRSCEGLEVTCAFLIGCWLHVDGVSRSERGEVRSSFLPDRQTNCQDRDQNSCLSAFKWCVNNFEDFRLRGDTPGRELSADTRDGTRRRGNVQSGMTLQSRVKQGNPTQALFARSMQGKCSLAVHNAIYTGRSAR